MRISFLLFIFCAATIASAMPSSPLPDDTARQTENVCIDTLFTQVPMKELPLLETNPRLDMLDLYNYKMTARGENIFGGYSTLLKKKENYIDVQLTEVSKWELMRLRTDSSGIYACTHTITAPFAESRTVFYNQSWLPESSTKLPSVKMEAFWNDTDSISTERMEELKRQLHTAPIFTRWQDTETSRPALIMEIST